MGRYITPDELFFKYPSLKKLGGGNIKTVNSFFIVPAEDFLDGRLAGSFSTPFSTAYPVVKELTMMATYFGAMVDRDNKKASAVEKLFEKRIEMILSGDLSIHSDVEITDDAAFRSNVNDYHPTHSMLDEESEYTIVSSERLADEEDLRD